jgi:hypothetical protein
MNAVVFMMNQQQAELHDMERPIASLTSLTANANRDSKKQPKPYGPEDFYWYQTTEPGKYPGARYGAAAVEMARRGLLPRWALFAYRDLKVNANDAKPPEPLFLIHQDAVILGPVFSDAGVQDMLLATVEASSRTLEMTLPGDDRTVRVAIPHVGDAVVAVEDVTLQVFW